MVKAFSLFGLSVAVLASTVSGLIPITIKGSRFVRPGTQASDAGQEFIILGVDYQPGGSSSFDPSGSSDVLTDQDACLRDAFVLQQLGVNTIRVYSVNPWLNHDACMSVFNAAGIYVVLDVNNPYQSLSRSDPNSTYNEGYLNNVFGVIDAFKGYPNVLGFFSGNEVVNDKGSAEATPQYIRAVQRDMKQYISLHADRPIPVGYSSTDDIALRLATWQYLQCGNDTSKSDFYGLNSYEWCSGQNDWQSSGYGTLESSFNDTSIPVFLSEYGCNTVSPRTFTEVNEGIYAELENVSLAVWFMNILRKYPTMDLSPLMIMAMLL
ncbi:Gas3p [Sugiyamaella lignohabitans]|uniref:1,3-beta-glucanosyltransferase n=1 Tax=Sugiyamaella lignohabitans TaxID=796027 RepID=A0A167E0R7_9ASCO|nr:Gas3p [Sugiyamaella lignohabitans]ANB13514.1 Gas3p [Sugiyamaella lignohabitans]